MSCKCRIACLMVENFPLAALCRAEPELCGQPVAVTDGRGAQATIVAVSHEAAQAGISKGISSAQALAVLSVLLLRPLCKENLRATENALADVAYSFSPCVEKAGGGLVFLEVSGSMALHEGENQLAAAIASRGKRVGLKVRIGIASSKIVARLAACVAEALVVPPGKEAHFMARLPIDLLQPSGEVAVSLSRWGIKRIWQLASLPSDQVIARLGKEGWDLVRKTRGEDLLPLSPAPRATEFAEGMELEYALETVEPLLFVFRAMFNRLLSRLALQALVPGDLRLSLGLAGTTRGEVEERTIALVAPTSDVKVLLILLRLNLERKPPTSAVERLRLCISPARLRPTELGLFSPVGPAPQKLAATVAKLVANCGAERVGMATIIDSHHPDKFELLPFSSTEQLLEPGGTKPLGELSHIVLRAIRPPLVVEVFCDRGLPGFVRGQGIGGRVVNLAGPWRIEGEWWTEGSFIREYFDVELSDGCIYRMYRDLRNKQWFSDGIYD